ncbi:DUF2390 domain-containing protein [Marinobacter lacisalsi]|uniref:DUF2390 domain-containing protein n=1 Tax=Marinobacter lacisalsi TaxID=475979 RepID=A0ABV8QLT9_9GAMM
MSDGEIHNNGPETDTPLWRFALSLWQQEAARNLCLALQEQGWSVTRLLCAGWLASQGLAYTGSEPQAIGQWRRNVTESIRSLKKSLNKSDSLLIPLRESLARAELEAERIELYRAWLVIRQSDLAGMPEEGDRMEANLRQAAPATNGSNHETTEPMIRHLAQLMMTTSAGQRHRQGSQQT